MAGVPWARRIVAPIGFKVHKASTAYLTKPIDPRGDVRAQLDELLRGLDAAHREQIEIARRTVNFAR